MDERRFESASRRASISGSYVVHRVLYSGLLEADSDSTGAVMRFQHGNTCPCYYCVYHMKNSGCIPSLENAKFIAWFNFWTSMERLFKIKP